MNEIESNKMKVYLAGPIKGQTYQQCTEVRERIANKLTNVGIVALSPMRGKEYLESEEYKASIQDNYESFPLSTMKGIVCRDHNDVRNCNAVLMDLREATQVSIGTMIEVGWSNAYGKPIVLLMEKDNIHKHGMLTEIVDFWVQDEDLAIYILTQLNIYR